MNTAYLIDTPGYYFAFGYWVASIALCSCLPLKHSIGRTWITRVVLLIIQCAIMVGTDGFPKWCFVPIMLVVIAINYLLFFLTCDLDAVSSGYYCVNSFVTGEFIASLSWQIYYYITLRTVVIYRDEMSFLTMVVNYCIAYVILQLLNRNLKGKIQGIRIGKRDLITIICCGLAVFVISNISYVYGDTPFSSQFSKEVFIIRTLTDFAGVALLHAYNIKLIQVHYQLEAANLQNLFNAQYHNYKLAESSIELVNQKYHDLKHHIAVFKEGAVNYQGFAESLEQMEQEIKSYEAQNKTGNKVLDVILTSKSLYCQKHNIQLITIVDGASLEFMDIMDISALFGNILDNAIENTMKVEEKEKRLIHLTITTQKGFLRIRTENYFNGELKIKNGLPVTLKSDKLNHGLGLKSIKAIVEKYHGSMTFDTKNQWFELRILIPLLILS